jgi:Flp pilus assembly protein TadG
MEKINMKKTRDHQSGQALILIVFAIVGLIGLTALTVDGSNAYSDRRHAQNASDTAAFAAARAKIRGEDWKQAALSIAGSNGYSDTNPTIVSTVEHTNVEVYRCDDSDATCTITLAPGDTLENYLQVKITSTIKTYFGGVIGVWNITNRVNSIVRVTDPINKPIGNGSAMWSLSDECSAITYGGSAAVTLLGSGIYVNSTCDPDAFVNTSNSPGLTAPCIQSAGGINDSGGSVYVQNGCLLTNQPVLPYPVLPDFSDACPADGSILASDSDSQTLSPGKWSGAFPPGNKKITNLQSGVYCVSANNQNFSLNANQVINGVHVTINLISGGVTFNGQATVRLSAPDSGPYKGLLLYLPPTNSNPVSINGGGDSKIVGTILAPSSQCNVLGGGGQEGLQTQLTCNEIKLGGGGNVTIVYNSELQYHPPIPPSIELTK